MKRALTIILSALILLSFTGCNGNDNKTASGSTSSKSDTSSVSSSNADDDFTINTEAETEEMTVYTKSSKDYYWSPFGDDVIADYVTDEDKKAYFADMDSAIQIVPIAGGDGVMVAVKNGGEKKKLKVTVIDGEDPENPPKKLDENVAIDSYDPSDFNMPKSYYLKYEYSLDAGTKYESICASTGKEYSYLEKEADDNSNVFSRYINTDDKAVYDFDGTNWTDQGYSEIDFESTVEDFNEGVYNPGIVFTSHFFGFSDVSKYYTGKETICGVECNVFEQKIADDHYYKYWVVPDSNIALKAIECLPGSGTYKIEATSYLGFLDEIPANLNLKP